MGFENCSKFHHQPREMGTLLVTMARSKLNCSGIYAYVRGKGLYIFPSTVENLRF